MTDLNFHGRTTADHTDWDKRKYRTLALLIIDVQTICSLILFLIYGIYLEKLVTVEWRLDLNS